MTIEMNGETREVEPGTLAEILEQLGFTDAKIATAVNGEFAPVTMRGTIRLHEGDRLEVVAPMQGG